MFAIRKLISAVIRIVSSAFLFLFISTITLGLLSNIYGFDYDILSGQRMVKNGHLLVALVISITIVVIINVIVSKLITNSNIHSQTNDLNTGTRRQKTNEEYDYLNDMYNNFVDDIPDDVIDDRYLDFIDEIPRDEKLNKFGSLIKSKPINKVAGSRSNVLTQTLMVYHGGGLYRGSRPVKIKVTNKGLHYGIYFIDKQSIKAFDITEKTEMNVKRSNNPSPLQLLLFGPLSLLFTSTGSQMIEAEGKVLNIDYLENGENHTLLLEGPSAPEVERSLREMQSTFS